MSALPRKTQRKLERIGTVLGYVIAAVVIAVVAWVSWNHGVAPAFGAAHLNVIEAGLLVVFARIAAVVFIHNR